MKKIKKLIILIIISIAIVAFNKVVYASESVTYFSGETIKFNEKESIEILSNELKIDTTTSHITNEFIIQNTSTNEIDVEISVPLENKKISTTVNNVSIKINDVDVTYINKDGDYIIKTKMQQDEAKKIEVNYNTDNNLQNAKIIKYNFDNFDGKIIKKVKVDIIISEKDIPLVTGIYPGHYTFEDNTISVEYYNMKVNNITRNVILEKETYNNLMHARKEELTEYDQIVLSNFDNWLENGLDISYSNKLSTYSIKENIIGTEIGNYIDDKYVRNLSNTCENILNYIIYKQFVTDNKIQIYVENESGAGYRDWNNIHPLIVEYIKKNIEIQDRNEDDISLAEKIVCIDYVETEDDKELYVLKNTSGKDFEEPGYSAEYMIVPEREILKTKGPYTGVTGNYLAKIIFVGEGIDGEKIDVTEEEKVEYINSINADFYVRVEIYDGEDNKKVGYYRNSERDIAKDFLTAYNGFNISEDVFNKRKNNEYSSYQEYLNEHADRYVKDLLIKLDNDLMEECKIPTLVQFVANRKTEDGRYVITYNSDNFVNSWHVGLSNLRKTIDGKEAQRMISENRQENDEIKTEIEEQISNITFSTTEQEIQNQIKQEEKEKTKNENQEESVKNETINGKNKKLELKDIIVLSIIGIAIICLIIIIFK